MKLPLLPGRPRYFVFLAWINTPGNTHNRLIPKPEPMMGTAGKVTGKIAIAVPASNNWNNLFAGKKLSGSLQGMSGVRGKQQQGISPRQRMKFRARFLSLCKSSPCKWKRNCLNKWGRSWLVPRPGSMLLRESGQGDGGRNPMVTTVVAFLFLLVLALLLVSLSGPPAPTGGRRRGGKASPRAGVDLGD